MGWLREPLLHFTLGGALLFAGHAWLNPSAPAPASSQIRIGANEVKWLSATWRGQSGREPTPEELRELVVNLLKEELLSREAREMRLDENDTIVRRRLAQKLEFVVQDTARLAQPSEDELRRFYEASPQAFLSDARVSFSQAYFSRERRKDAAKDAAAALHRLAKAPASDAAALGDRLMVDAEFRDADRQAVAAAFGPQFARAVFDLPPGAWHGPIESGYGLHLVRVVGVRPAQRREFAEVRPQVLERWREQRLREAETRFFERLMAKYEVLIDEDVKATIGATLNLVSPK